MCDSSFAALVLQQCRCHTKCTCQPLSLEVSKVVWGGHPFILVLVFATQFLFYWSQQTTQRLDMINMNIQWSIHNPYQTVLLRQIEPHIHQPGVTCHLQNSISDQGFTAVWHTPWLFPMCLTMCRYTETHSSFATRYFFSSSANWFSRLSSVPPWVLVYPCVEGIQNQLRKMTRGWSGIAEAQGLAHLVVWMMPFALTRLIWNFGRWERY